jgi:hypothetical protein
LSRPARPSLTEALTPAFSRRGDPELVERWRAAMLGGGRCDDDLVARVAAFLEAHPSATGSAVAAAVRGRKQDVLAVVRLLRSVPTGSRERSGTS